MNLENIVLIALLVTAHCVSDLLLRPNNGSKSRSLHYFLTLHSSIHFGVGLLLTLFMISGTILLILVAIAVSHYLIDLFKSKVLRSMIKNGDIVDIIDQLMHLTAIVSAVYLIY